MNKIPGAIFIPAALADLLIVLLAAACGGAPAAGVSPATHPAPSERPEFALEVPGPGGFVAEVGPEEYGLPPRLSRLVTTSPDNNLPMVKIDGRFYLFAWGGVPLAPGESRTGDWFCQGDDLCDGMYRLSGETLDRLVYDPADESGVPIAVWRRPPVGASDPRVSFSDMWPFGLYYRRDADELLVFNSSDERTAADPNTSSGAWYGTGELLISRDRGRTFRRGGRILSPAVPKSEWDRMHLRYGNDRVGVFGITHSDATISPDGEYVYLFFAFVNDSDERLGLGRRAGDLGAGLALARSRIDGDSTGRPGTWEFWHDGGFTQPGLGGRIGILVQDLHLLDVSWNRYLGRFVCIGTAFGRPIEERGYRLYTSPDGIAWTDHGMLWKTNTDFDVPEPPASTFASILSPETDWDGYSAAVNWLYYTYVPENANDPDRREIRRRALRFRRPADRADR